MYDIDRRVRSVLGHLGLIAVRKGMADEAEKLFEGLRALDETRVGPAVGLAQAYMANDKIAEATEVLAPHAEGGDPDARLYLGLAYWLQRKDAEALALWRPIADGDDNRAVLARNFMSAGEELRAKHRSLAD